MDMNAKSEVGGQVKELPDYAKQLSEPFQCGACEMWTEYTSQVQATGLCWSCRESLERQDSGI